MPPDPEGDIIELQRQLRAAREEISAALKRIYTLERQQQLFIEWVDRTGSRLEAVEGRVQEMDADLEQVCEAVAALVDDIYEDETSDGQTVN